MDVILDSNRILRDPRMEGTEFQILFRYLRRTGSCFVIPKIVKDEVLARYPELVQKQQQKLVSALSALKGLCFCAQLPKLPVVEIESEVAAFRARLLTPTLVDILEVSGNSVAPKQWQYVSSISTGDYSAITVEELARRGINRVKPASSSGEEFRDVILWLMVLNYGKEKGQQVALISEDGDFFESKNSNNLHAQLGDEARREGVEVKVYRSIGDFFKAASPSEPIEDPWIRTYVTSNLTTEIESLLEKAVASYLEIGWRSRSEVTSLGDASPKFKKGMLYNLAPDSQYAELEYEGTATFAIGPYVFTKAPPFNPKDYKLDDVRVHADFVVSLWIVGGQIASTGLEKMEVKSLTQLGPHEA